LHSLCEQIIANFNGILVAADDEGPRKCSPDVLANRNLVIDPTVVYHKRHGAKSPFNPRAVQDTFWTDYQTAFNAVSQVA